MFGGWKGSGAKAWLQGTYRLDLSSRPARWDRIDADGCGDASPPSRRDRDRDRGLSTKLCRPQALRKTSAQYLACCRFTPWRRAHSCLLPLPGWGKLVAYGGGDGDLDFDYA